MRLLLLLYSSLYLVTSIPIPDLYQNTLQSQASAEDNANSESYDTLSNESKFEVVKDEMDHIMSKFYIGGPGGLENAETYRIEQELHDYVNNTIRHKIMEHVLNELGKNYTTESEAQFLIGGKQATVAWSQPKPSKRVLKLLAMNVLTNSSVAPVIIRIIQSEIEGQLVRLLRKSKGNDLEKLVEAKLAEIRSFNTTGMMEQANVDFQKNYGKSYKDYDDLMAALAIHWENEKNTEYCEKSAFMTEERTQFFDEMMLFEQECKEMLQAEIDAVQAKEKSEDEIYKGLTTESKVDLLKKKFADLMDAVRVFGRKALDAGESSAREFHSEFKNIFRDEVRKQILDELIHTDNIRARRLIVEKQEELRWNKTENSRGIADYMQTISNRMPHLERLTLQRKQKTIRTELTKLLKESNSTELQQIVNTTLAEVETLQIDAPFDQGMLIFWRETRTFGPSLKDVVGALKLYWKNKETTEDGRKVIDTLSEDGKKTFEEMVVFGKEYKENLQQEIDTIESKGIEGSEKSVQSVKFPLLEKKSHIQAQKLE